MRLPGLLAIRGTLKFQHFGYETLPSVYITSILGPLGSL